MTNKDLKIRESYMVLIPNNFTHIDAEEVSLGSAKDAPYFFELDIETKLTNSETKKISGRKVKIDYHNIDDEVILAEANFELGDTLDDSTVKKKSEITAKIKDYILNALGYTGDFVEEYSTTFISGINTKPEIFVTKHRFFIARLIRSMEERINENDMEEILYSKLTYSTNDMTIVDWQGTVVIGEDEEGIDSDMSLIKIANYQLLRYRLLDQTIDDNVQNLRKYFNKKSKFVWKNKFTDKDVLITKIELLLDFERIDQFLLLIGDWHSAKLYRTIYEELYLDQWRKIVKDKIGTLTEIYETFNEKFTMSFNKWGSKLELLGWLILLAGYFVLFYMEVKSA